MAGWGSNNKFSMLGAMRAIAQMISYELPLIITVLPVVMVVGSLNPDKIVVAQKYYHFGFLPHWFVLTPWGATAFILFFVSGLVESNRTPFDVPEGESEIVAGHMTEYSGFKYATFFMAEYLGMFAVSGLAVTLFLGGWHAPLPWLAFVPSYVWFFAKLSVLLFVFIWIRGTLPRMRVDQMMNFAWKFMLPMAFTCFVSAAVWHYNGRRLARMALVVCGHCCGLRRAFVVSRYPKEIRAAHLSFRRMNTVAFAVIAIFTLTFALAAATNPRLMHAALSFAVMFVGIAAFFFLAWRRVRRPRADLCLRRRGRSVDCIHDFAHPTGCRTGARVQVGRNLGCCLGFCRIGAGQFSTRNLFPPRRQLPRRLP